MLQSSSVGSKHAPAFGGYVKKITLAVALIVFSTLSLAPSSASGQSLSDAGTAVAAQTQDAGGAANRRLRIGVQGGVALDPELIDVGVHATLMPIFHRRVGFRPGAEIAFGELTTLFGINLDVLYTLPGSTGTTRWAPYVGAGPNFALSHRGFETDDASHVTATVTTGSTTTTGTTVVDERSRFDFGDTDFTGGFNFIAGARNPRGTFFEIKATAWGVSTIRLLAGFDF
jgi:hypothetical protein